MIANLYADKNFQAILNALPVPLAIHDNHGNITFLNKAFETVFGYTTDDIPTLDAWWPTAYPDPEYRKRLATIWQDYIEEARRTGRPFAPLEANVRCKDGSIRTISCRAAPLGEDPLECHLVILHDMTEQKRSEDELRMTRVSVEAASDAVYWVTADARIVDVNPAACESLGYTREELLQMTVPDIDPHFNVEVWHRQFPELRQKRTMTFETEQRASDGRLIPIEVVANYVRFEEREFSCAFCRDITERKRAEEALRASEEKYHRLVEGLSDRHCVFSHTAEGIFLYVSKHFDKLFGVAAESIIGRDWRSLSLTPESLAAGEVADRRIIEEQCMQTVELTCIHPDGSRHIIEVTYGPVVEEGRVVLMEGICTDITEIKQSAASLATAREAAESANLAKSVFLANMSHEIRTPITAIIGYTELLEDTELSARQQNYLETIASSAETLIMLIDDILDLAKIEAGKMELECQAFRLSSLVGEVIGSQSVAARVKGLSVKSSIKADVPDTLAGDALRLKQILLNLVGNAVKFTEHGEVTLSVAVEERQSSTVILRFAVTDTGIGIKPGDMARIFQPFSQADSSTTRKFGGTGLGLAICTKLASLMGGEIRAESLEGAGSTFRLRMPLAFSADHTHTSGTQPVGHVSRRGGKPLRILLVEDYEISQRFFAEALTRYGHQVDVARDGAEALGKWRHGAYDIILMDLQMPVMDGFETLGEIRRVEKEKGGHIPVVALTAHAMEEDRRNVLEKGFDGYVAKPVRMTDLFGEIRRCVVV